jgi:hypothetical protein
MPAPRDPFPSDEEIQAANAGLVAVVRRHLPTGFYARSAHWSLWSTVALVRMADTVDAAMALMKGMQDVDGRTLIRSLYEQVVTYAWIAIDPGPRYSRWFGESVWADLRLHNDAVTFGEWVLTEEEVVRSTHLLGLGEARGADAAADTCQGTRKRKTPAADLLLPAVPERARDADAHWSTRIAGLHAPGSMLSFRGLYLPAYRQMSRATHSALSGLDVYVRERSHHKVVGPARRPSRLAWALVGPMFGMGLIIAAQDEAKWWIDEREVRALVDRATGPAPEGASATRVDGA